MSRLFICYRRDDSGDASGRLYDRLEARYGHGSIFKDVDDIPIGIDFRKVLRDEVARCDVMLVVIGRQWLNSTDDTGRRRLDSSTDFVRIEIEAALSRGIPVVPVLVQNAVMPTEADLPSSLSDLAFRHGFVVHADPHFNRDVDQLAARLDHLLPAMTRDRFPERLERLGFVAHKRGNTEYIVPPTVNVPAGDFQMGGDPTTDTGTRDNEKPQHKVTLSGFQIGRFPVTVAEYACFVRGGQREPSNWQPQLTKLDHPVVYVTWRDAMDYATWLAKQTGQPWRLPTEVEWEKAARWDSASRTARIYPWGDTFDPSRCNTIEGGKGSTTPIGSYAQSASPYGGEDMAGNVWEWTISLFRPYPYNKSDGREDEESQDNRVLRGGSWNYDAINARSAFRSVNPPGNANLNRGLRLLLVSAKS